jgi:uncharacterized protein
MATVFNAFEKTPGVYIQEILVPGPIPGVGTSTAAFIGPARRGRINDPVSLTNWTQFRDAFGLADDFGPYFPTGGVFLAHAVRGFFDNGGSHCYVVRVGTAARASRALDDRGAAPKPALVVTAKDEGVAGNGISVEVQDSSLATAVATSAESNLTAAANKQATVAAQADADRFKPGDIVFLEEAAKNDRVTVASITGTTITFETNLANTYTGAGKIRVADLAPGQTHIRVADVSKLEPGTYVEISQGGPTDTAVIQAVEAQSKFVTITPALTKTFTLKTGDPAVDLKTREFTLVVKTPGGGTETFSNLSMDPRHSGYVLRALAAAPPQSVDVALADPPTPTPPPKNVPAVLAATVLQGGQADDLSSITSVEYTNALTALEKVDDVNILCVPDGPDMTIQKAMVDHCEKMQDRFAIFDPPSNLTPAQITALRNDPSYPATRNGYAALYYPQIYVSNPVGPDKGTPLKVPPSGHVAGLYARVDNDRGVHKAPANESLRGVLRVERALSDDEHGPLNEKSVNVIRAFTGRGILVWGARTLSTETQWRYINVRRLLLFIEESIQEGTQFAVFEPNNLELWQKLKRQVSEFLDRVWRSGALLGAKPEEAYRVRIDDELNPPATIALGQLVIEVRLAPTTPAEFVVFQIIQEPGRKIVNE